MHKIILDEAKIVKLYLENKLSMETIASQEKCPEHVIRHRLKILGIKSRKQGEIRHESKLGLDIEYFKEINTAEKAYWLGVICADGWISRANKTKDLVDNKIGLVLKDEEHIIKFKKAIKSEHKISKIQSFDKRTNKIYTRFGIQVTSKDFVKYLINQGITKNKSYVCEFPKIPSTLESHFLRGLYDGDGGISKTSNGDYPRISLIATKTQMDYILLINDKLGIPRLTLTQITKNNLNIICFNLVSTNAIKFLRYIYQDSEEHMRMDRKYNKFLYYNNFKLYEKI